MYYIFVQDGKLNGAGQCPCLNEDIQNIEIAESIYNSIIEDKDTYIWDGTNVVVNPDYEEIKRQEERQRLDALNLTKADFWIALLEKDITKEMVKEKINLIPDEKLKAKTLIRLDEADHFWRGDASMNIIGGMFGITPEDLDYLFENGKLPSGETSNVDT